MPDEPDGEIIKGKLLVAMPVLSDPNFWQTVVLICEHNEEGSLGLVMNRPMPVTVSTLIEGLPRLTGTEPVYAGGPVAQSGMLVLCRGHRVLEEHAILEDVFLARDADVLKLPQVLGDHGEARCYLGYAGWSAGQLSSEFQSGGWRMISADSALLFDLEPTAFWPEMMRRLGPDYSFYATMPFNPRMN